MKNAFVLFTVCLSIFIFSCGQKSTQNPSSEDISHTETASIETVETSVLEEELVDTSSLDSSLIASNEDIITDKKDESTPKSEHKKTDMKEEKPTTKVSPPSPQPHISTPQPKPIPTNPTPSPTPKPIPPTSQAQTKPVTPTSQPETKPAAIKTTPPTQPEKPAPVPFSHDVLDEMLRKNVSASGVVDYRAFKNQISTLKAYLVEMEAFAPKADWSRNREMAYWFNLYNAWMIMAVAEKYPIKSPMDLDGGNTWKVKRAKSGRNTYSLDEVENKIIRPKFKDARIHFAVNCAAKSCPPLLNRAWTESNVESYLEQQTRKFINDPNHNIIEKKNVKVSQIFEWYADDFGDLISFLNKYSSTTIDSKAKIEYIPYNWDLNGK